MNHVVESLQSFVPEFNIVMDEGEAALGAADGSGQQLINVLREMSDGEARGAITDLLHSLNIRIDTRRARARSLIVCCTKSAKMSQGPKLRSALDFMTRLGELFGSPADLLPRARSLAAEYNLDWKAISALEDTWNAWREHGDLRGEIELDLA